jgi:hypothetical protein
MSIKQFLTLMVGLVVTFGAAQADAADRFFQVQVSFIAGGQSPFWEPPSPPGPNCYSFLEDGTWDDPQFVPGEWEPDEDGVGMVERYTAWAQFELEGEPWLLVQEGHVTPARGNGRARLQAFSTFSIGGEVFAEFMSTGYEVDECP